MHLAVDHHGDSVPLTAKLLPPFAGNPGDNIGLQISGAVHVFGADGLRLASGTGELR